MPASPGWDRRSTRGKFLAVVGEAVDLAAFAGKSRDDQGAYAPAEADDLG